MIVKGKAIYLGIKYLQTRQIKQAKYKSKMFAMPAYTSAQVSRN